MNSHLRMKSLRFQVSSLVTWSLLINPFPYFSPSPYFGGVATAPPAPIVEEAAYGSSYCPKGYIPVPGNSSYRTPGTGQDFCVMKYGATDNGSRVAESKATGTPWVSINRANAKKACEANNLKGDAWKYDLLSNDQWMTIARNVESNPMNWSDGAVGSGFLPRGNTHSGKALAPGSDDSDPYFGLDSTQRDDNPLKKKAEWQEYSSEYFIGKSAKADRYRLFFAPAGPHTSRHNTGQVYMHEGGAVLRGGAWYYNIVAGVFGANLINSADDEINHVGFRCAATPI